MTVISFHSKPLAHYFQSAKFPVLTGIIRNNRYVAVAWFAQCLNVHFILLQNFTHNKCQLIARKVVLIM